MAPARLSADVDAEPPGLSASVPLSPAEVIRRGMVEGGKRVRRYSVDFDTGEVSLTFDTAAGANDEARRQLSQTARDILEVLEDRNGEWVHGWTSWPTSRGTWITSRPPSRGRFRSYASWA